MNPCTPRNRTRVLPGAADPAPRGRTRSRRRVREATLARVGLAGAVPPSPPPLPDDEGAAASSPGALYGAFVRGFRRYERTLFRALNRRWPPAEVLMAAEDLEWHTRPEAAWGAARLAHAADRLGWAAVVLRVYFDRMGARLDELDRLRLGARLRWIDDVRRYAEGLAGLPATPTPDGRAVTGPAA